MAKTVKRAIVLRVSTREFDAILAALRFWQREREDKGEMPMADIAEEHGKALSITGIDDLCQRINTGG